MAQRFKSPEWVSRPNPVALALRTTRAFGTRRMPVKSKRRYSRTEAKREATRQNAG